MNKIAIFPGSFDPFHKGHKYVVDTALKLFDEVVVCLAFNPDKKKGYFDPWVRENRIKEIFKDEPRVKVVVTNGLVVDKAKEVGATAIVKGARNGTDFDYENAQANVNMKVGNIPTIIVPTPGELMHVSSTAIRTLLTAGHGNAELVRDMMP